MWGPECRFDDNLPEILQSRGRHISMSHLPGMLKWEEPFFVAEGSFSISALRKFKRPIWSFTAQNWRATKAWLCILPVHASAVFLVRQKHSESEQSLQRMYLLWEPMMNRRWNWVVLIWRSRSLELEPGHGVTPATGTILSGMVSCSLPYLKFGLFSHSNKNKSEKDELWETFLGYIKEG